MDKQYRICFLGYRTLSTLAQSAIESLNLPDTDIHVVECNVETLQKTVDRALSEGYEIFIAGSANAAEFRRHYHAHLVEISLRAVDYLIAIKKAQELGERPVLALYRYGRQVDVPMLSSLAGISLETITYEDSADLQEGIRNTAGDVIVGAGHANELASELGKKSVLLYPGEDSIKSAIRRARTLSAELEREMQKTRTIQTILRDAPIGLIVTDMSGRVTLFNRAARRYAQTREETIQGRFLEDVLPALSPEEFLNSGERESDQRKLFNGVMLRCVNVRIQDRQRPVGVLTTIYPDNTRRKKEENPVAEQFRVSISFKDVIGESAATKKLIQEIRAVADTDYPLLVTGEHGTGKTFVGRLVHAASRRKKEPCIPINIAAIPDQDAARVLYGYEGPEGTRPGLLETAGNGTVIFQNLNLTSRVVQSCLHQTISDRSYLRVGGVTPIPFSARVITILDSDLDEKYGADVPKIFPPLLDNLSVLTLRVPALRERREDIPALFAGIASQESLTPEGKRTLKADSEVLRYYSWPGNLFELTTACRRYSFLLSQASSTAPNARHLLLLEAIGEEKLFQEILSRHPALKNAAKSPTEELLAGLEDLKHILKYNNETIAERLSLSRTTLWRLTKGREN